MKYDFNHWDKTEMTREEALAVFESDFEVFGGKRCNPTCPRCQAMEWAIKALKMTSDTISRQAAIDAIRASASKYTGFMAMEVYTDDDAAEAIKGVPSAQSDRKKGKWIGKPIAGYAKVRCSVCNVVFRENNGKWNFCPVCGAYNQEETSDD